MVQGQDESAAPGPDTDLVARKHENVLGTCPKTKESKQNAAYIKGIQSCETGGVFTLPSRYGRGLADPAISLSCLKPRGIIRLRHGAGSRSSLEQVGLRTESRPLHHAPCPELQLLPFSLHDILII